MLIDCLQKSISIMNEALIIYKVMTFYQVSTAPMTSKNLFPNLKCPITKCLTKLVLMIYV